HKIMQINLNPTSERGASRDAVNRPRETLGDSHLISSDPRSRFGLVCDLLCCRGNSSMAVRHQGDMKEFRELSFAEQAKSITATINNLQAAIEHHVEHSPLRLETIEKSLAQIER